MRIKKVAVSPIPEINGSVVDSFNVEDKTTNAPSVNAVENAIKIEELTVNDIMTLESGFSLSSTGNALYRQGKRIWGTLTINKSSAYTSNANTTIGVLKLPPAKLTFCNACSTDSVWNIGTLVYIVLENGKNGRMIAKVNNTSHTTIKCFIDYVIA